MSADGRFVAFYSTATNLVPAGPSGNIFVRDTCLGAPTCTPQTLAVDLDVNGNASWHSFEQTSSNQRGWQIRRFPAPPRSPNLAVGSDASGQGSGAKVYLRDLCAGDDAPAGCTPQTQLVSVDALGAPTSGALPAVSSDGRFVAFVSTPTAPLTVTAPQAPRIYLRDTCAGPTANSQCAATTVSVDLNGGYPDTAASLAISGSGRYVAFTVFPQPTVVNATESRSAISLADTCAGADTPAGCTAKTISISRSPLTDRHYLAAIPIRQSAATAGSSLLIQIAACQPDPSATQIYVPRQLYRCDGPEWMALRPPCSQRAGRLTSSISGSGQYITYVAGQNVGNPSGPTSGSLYIFDTCFGGATPCVPVAVSSWQPRRSANIVECANRCRCGSVVALTSTTAVDLLPSSGLGDVYAVPIFH